MHTQDDEIGRQEYLNYTGPSSPVVITGSG